MPEKEHIKYFVQQTLECGCPEEVFNNIECKFNVELRSDLRLNAIINIGHRLLIYMIDVGKHEFTESHLAFLILTAKRERDSKGLNRVRLVVVAADAREQRSLERAFDRLRGTDKKIHLHFIDQVENIFASQKEQS